MVGLLKRRHGKISIAALALMVLLTACQGQPQEAQEVPAPEMREVVDMAGRQVEVPVEIDQIYATDPVASILLYTLDPSMLLGWNYPPNDTEKTFILEAYRDLPAFGMGDGVNLEAIIQAAPDLCLQVGGMTEKDIETADRLQSQLGIPVVILDGAMESTPETYRQLGELVQNGERAEDLAQAVEGLFEQTWKIGLRSQQPPRVYYGNGANSLETAAPNSPSAAIFDLLLADNVVEVEQEGGSRIQITLEQLLSWNPDYMFINGEPKQGLGGTEAAEVMAADPAFASLSAVQKGQIYGVPQSPFAWMGRPIGVNRLPGVIWAGHILYPDLFGADLEAAIADFYETFYHLQLTAEDLEALLQ